MKKANEFKVGLLVLAGIGIFIMANWIIKGESFSNEGYYVYLSFKSLDGLKVGNEVRMAEGVKIGKVRYIKMKNNRANVQLWIKQGVNVSSASLFSIKSASFFGEKYVSIAHKPGEGNILRGGETLRGEEPISLMGSLGELGKLMKNLNALVGGDNSTFIKNFTRSIDNTTKKLDNILAKSGNDIQNTLKNFSRASRKIDRLVTDFSGVGKKLNKLLSTFQTTGNTLNNKLPSSLKALKNSANLLATILKKMNSGKGVIASALNDRRLYYDIKFILENLKRFTFKLRQDPSLLIWKKK